MLCVDYNRQGELGSRWLVARYLYTVYTTEKVSGSQISAAFTALQSVPSTSYSLSQAR